MKPEKNSRDLPSKYAQVANNLIDVLSRVFALLLLMVAPGLIGVYLDRRLETSYLAGLGFLLGTLFCIAGMILLVKTLERQKKPGQAEDLQKEKNLQQGLGQERFGNPGQPKVGEQQRRIEATEGTVVDSDSSHQSGNLPNGGVRSDR